MSTPITPTEAHRTLALRVIQDHWQRPSLNQIAQLIAESEARAGDKILDRMAACPVCRGEIGMVCVHLSAVKAKPKPDASVVGPEPIDPIAECVKATARAEKAEGKLADVYKESNDQFDLIITRNMELEAERDAARAELATANHSIVSSLLYNTLKEKNDQLRAELKLVKSNYNLTSNSFDEATQEIIKLRSEAKIRDASKAHVEAELQAHIAEHAKLRSEAERLTRSEREARGSEEDLRQMLDTYVGVETRAEKAEREVERLQSCIQARGKAHETSLHGWAVACDTERLRAEKAEAELSILKQYNKDLKLSYENAWTGRVGFEKRIGELAQELEKESARLNWLDKNADYAIKVAGQPNGQCKNGAIIWNPRFSDKKESDIRSAIDKAMGKIE